MIKFVNQDVNDLSNSKLNPLLQHFESKSYKWKIKYSQLEEFYQN